MLLLRFRDQGRSLTVPRLYVEAQPAELPLHLHGKYRFLPEGLLSRRDRFQFPAQVLDQVVPLIGTIGGQAVAVEQGMVPWRGRSVECAGGCHRSGNKFAALRWVRVPALVPLVTAGSRALEWG